MCDLAHVLVAEHVERIAIADRQALLTAAQVNGAENYEPLSVEKVLADFEERLAAEQGVSVDPFIRRIQQQVMGVAA